MKSCFKCGAEKDFSKFYKHKDMSDGYLNKCIDCCKKDSIINRNNRINYYREYDRKRGSRLSNDYISKYRERNKEKYIAHTKVNNAVRDGRLIKESCVFCGDTKSVGHHEDYSKPLDVIWLCQKHHKAIHLNKIWMLNSRRN